MRRPTAANADVFRQSVVRKLAARGVTLLLGVLLVAPSASAQHSPELASLDLWIVQRFRGAQLLPDTTGRVVSPVSQAGAPRVESARTPSRRDTVVALHFGSEAWRPSLTATSPVQLADPSGVISGIAGKVTARRAFRAPRKAGARDSVQGDWRIGWAYLVAIPTRTANAATSGLNGWALVDTAKVAPPKATARKVAPTVASPPEVPPATLPPIL